jgi:hypothetical protein
VLASYHHFEALTETNKSYIYILKNGGSYKLVAWRPVDGDASSAEATVTASIPGYTLSNTNFVEIGFDPTNGVKTLPTSSSGSSGSSGPSPSGTSGSPSSSATSTSGSVVHGTTDVSGGVSGTSASTGISCVNLSYFYFNFFIFIFLFLLIMIPHYPQRITPTLEIVFRLVVIIFIIGKFMQ